MEKTPQQFYDAMSGEYTDAIRRCVPRYDEMLNALLAYVPADVQPLDILELGCGTGNLTALLHARWPDARIHAVDVSGECIGECRKRLGTDAIQFVQSDFRDLEYAPASFDLTGSSIAIHHLRDDEKVQLFGNLRSWLRPGGVVVFSDQMSGETDELYAQHMRAWKMHAESGGVTQEEWHNWMQHQEQQDFHATLSQHLHWLREADFSIVDCPWRFLLWTIIIAQVEL